MIGILIVAHGSLGEALVDTAEMILGSRPEAMHSVSINISQDADKLRGRISKGIKTVNRQKGILILTDMFGGTPSNLSYSFLEEGKIEVISGVNLPMVIKAVNSRDKTELSKFAESLEAFGKRSITMASGILKGNKRT